MPTRVTTGLATAIGDRERNADAVAVHRYGSANVTAAAVIDGIGSTQEVVDAARAVAEVAVRVGARKGALPGMLAATELLADPLQETVVPDAVGCIAVIRPDAPVAITYVGDCRAYGWTGTELRLHTEDHTVGQCLRLAGIDEVTAAKHDHRVRTSIGRASIGLIDTARIEENLVILTSDGVHKALSHEEIAAVVRAHSRHPQALAEALIDTAMAAPVDPDNPKRDNASTVVLLIES